VSAQAQAASFSIGEKDLFHFTVPNPNPSAPCSNFTSANLPQGAQLVGSSGLFTWVPDYGSAGSYTVSFACADTPTTNPQQIIINVAAVTPVSIQSATPKVTLVTGAAPAGSDQDNDQKSIAVLLGIYGLNTAIVADLGATLNANAVGDILVVPSYAAASLSPETVQQVVTYVNNGGSVLLFGKSPLSQALGISYTDATGNVTQFIDYINPQLFQMWSNGEAVQLFQQNDGDIVFSIDLASGAPIAIGRSLNKGRVLYVGTNYYDHFSPYGTKGHPYLLYHVMDFFHLKPMVSAGSLDAYFDPGNYDLSKVSVESIVSGWVGRGITTVYAAAWQFWINEQTDQEWDFDYAHFISVCHLYGIKAYAWFELPEVSQKFWYSTPECREQTAGNGENYISWRLNVNLQNPTCLASVQQFVDTMMSSYDWDGLNLAEIYYDYDQDINYFTPMNADVRQNYAAISGFDPIQFFDPTSPHYYLVDTTSWQAFLNYRTGLVTGLHQTFLDTIYKEPGTAEREVILTVVDSLDSNYPDLQLPPGYLPPLNTGVDIVAIYGLKASYDYQLQVEDSWPYWNSNPYRYIDFKNTYLNTFPYLQTHQSDLMFDVNIVPGAHCPAGGAVPVPSFNFPANIQTGLEFSLLLKNLFGDNDRSAVFSENTIQAIDYDRLKWALAGDSLVNRAADGTLSFTVKRTTKLEGSPTFYNVTLNGKAWPAWSSVDGSILLPVGSSTVGLDTGAYTVIRLAAISCDLTDAGVVPGGISVQYDSPRQKAVLTIEAFDKLANQPFLVLLDGSVYTPDIYPYYGEYRFFLPKGSHTVQVYVMQDPGAPTNVMVSAVNNGQATVSFTAPLNDGLSPITSYTVTANPGNITATSSTSPFSTITVSGLNNSTSYTFTVQATNAVGTGSAATATANLYGLSVTINGTGSGSVNSSPSGINCINGTCPYDFNSGSTFSLLPSASTGSQFIKWGGACAGTGTCNVSVNAIYQSVTATFNSLTGARILATLQPYTLIQSAYNAAITGDVIQAQGLAFVENLTLGLPKAVTLMGGFDPAFSTQSSYTILQGILTIEQGSLVVDHLTIE
jgi:hypothetical protein